MFNDRKNPDTMYCFLVTFLPDESYTGNPALRSSNPLGSDYSGLAIYSYPDGTPAWGWRYDTGEITHTLPFDESYRDQSDADYRLQIDFGSDEYITRSNDETYLGGTLDEVLVPGYKPVPTPDLYRWSTSEAEDLIDLGDGRLGGSGPSGNSSQPTIKVDEKSKAKVNPLLDKIKLDCLGKLLTAFLNGNTGVSISVTDGLTSNGQPVMGTYNPANSTIVLNSSADDTALFEELYHAYQYNRNNGADRDYLNEYKGNTEIEAKMALYYYAIRTKRSINDEWGGDWYGIRIFSKESDSSNWYHAQISLESMGYDLNKIKTSGVFKFKLPDLKIDC